ncbi:MAG: metallo-mystery pair system four-Cys motif protein [Leptospira sp.]|nr:metallo-mystery pair system four-Cys motif protein [Leptospira sp.]
MKKLSFLIIAICILHLFACQPEKKDDSNTALALAAVIASGNAVTSIPFVLVAGTDTSFACNKTVTSHSEKHISESMNFSIRDARFFVYDVKLVRADGTTSDFTLTPDNTFQSSTVALLDFENKTGDCTVGTTDTNTTLKGFAVSGIYVGVQFKIGVPDDQNKLLNTTASAPLNASGMYWSWTSGYKFLKFEWLAKEGAGTTNQFHLGGGTCTGGNGSNLNCSYPNVPTVTVKTTNNTTWNPTTNPVYLDVKTLVNGTNSNLSDGGAAYTCMSGNTTARCKVLLNNVGVNETDGKTLTTQSAFYLKP